MRIMIHDRKGKPITPILTELECSWVISGEGKCTFPIALTDPKAARQLILNAGNLIHIQFDDFNFGWGGEIDGDQDWDDESDTIELSAWSAEHLLYHRRTPIDRVYVATSAGTMIEKLIELANAPEDLLIRPGAIYYGGGRVADTWDGKDIYTHVSNVAEMAGIDWKLEPALDANGYLYFVLNVYEKMGMASNQLIKQGFNCMSGKRPLRVRTNEMVNDLVGIGEGSTMSRPRTPPQIDNVSRSLYGLRQGTEDFETQSLSTLMESTRQSVIAKASPIRTHSIELLNVEGTFANLGLGNTYPLKAHTYGFMTDGSIGVDTTLRVIGMRYKSESDTVEVNGVEDE